MQRKSVLALLVAVAVLLVAAVPSSLAAFAAEADRELVGNTYVTGLPIVKEPESFTMAIVKYTLDKGNSIDEKLAFKQAEEATGVKVNIIEIPSGTETDKVNIMLASDLPDVFLVLLTEESVSKNTASLVNLSEPGLLEKWAPNIVAQYGEVPEMWDMLKFPDGNIYSLATGPQTSYDNDGQGITFINKVWLDKLGLEMPKTTEDFYNVLVAFRDGDPNGNGLKDEIPLEFARNNWANNIMNYAGPWGIAGGGSGDYDAYYKITDGKFAPTVNTQPFRDFLDFYHKLAAEGLLDVEGFSQTNQQYYAKLKEYVCGVYTGWTPESNFDAARAKEYVAMDVICAPGMEGQQKKHGRLNTFFGNRTGFVITKACKNVETVLRWWDYMSETTERKFTMKYGEEGILWERDASGQVWSIFPTNVTEDFTRENMKYTYGMVDKSPLIILREQEKNDPVKYPDSVRRASFVDVVKPYFNTEFLPTRFVSPEKKSEISVIRNELEVYMEGFVANAIMNGLDDAAWNAHLAQLDALGMQTWVQWNQDFIDGKF